MATPLPVTSYREGLRRVIRAPWVWLGVWAVTWLVAAPLALVLRDMIATHLGSSLLAREVASGAHWDWWQEFLAQASGIGTTFTPAILGLAAPLQNLSDLLDNAVMPTVIAGVVTAWLVIWSFLAGGILDRYARDRWLGSAGFFGACGTHFWRLLRLGALAGIVYALLFGYVHGWLLDDGLYVTWTRSTSVERQAFALRLGLYAVFLALLVSVNVVVDYARIRIVVEDRRSALFALLAGARFVWRHPAGCAALYGLNALTFLAVLGVYALVAPHGGERAVSPWLALVAGQVYIVLRLGAKLLFYASQTVFFQRLLAHAAYVAGPQPEWPESPAAEALRGAPGPPATP